MNEESYSMFTIVIPAKNEEVGLSSLLPELRQLYPKSKIIVVDDGSTDATKEVSLKSGAEVISQPYSKGNGAAIKAGLRAVTSDIVVCMDADGQHKAEDVSKLVAKLGDGFEMVVGARSASSQAGKHRLFANGFYNKFSSWVVGHQIKDLTSGFRAAKTEKMKQFLSLLPNKFSYPTTITMSFFRAGFSVGYEPLEFGLRAEGTSSHVNILRDGIRFLLIIFKVGTLFSPLKIFLPASLLFFLTGASYYVYTYFSDNRFTNMGLLLLSTAVIIFLLGLISEQITNLLYNDK